MSYLEIKIKQKCYMGSEHISIKKDNFGICSLNSNGFVFVKKEFKRSKRTLKVEYIKTVATPWEFTTLQFPMKLANFRSRR